MLLGAFNIYTIDTMDMKITLCFHGSSVNNVSLYFEVQDCMFDHC